MGYFLVGLGAFLADVFSKDWARKNLVLGEEVPVVKGKLHWIRVENKGAANGLLADNPRLLWLLTITSALNALCIYIRAINRHKDNGAYKFSLACVAGGALGNMWERLTRGRVTDFICVYPKKNAPAFNPADVFIFLGALVLLVKEFTRGRD